MEAPGQLTSLAEEARCSLGSCEEVQGRQTHDCDHLGQVKIFTVLCVRILGIDQDVVLIKVPYLCGWSEMALL